MQHIFPENCYQHSSLPIFPRSLHHVLIGNIFYKLVASVGAKKKLKSKYLVRIFTVDFSISNSEILVEISFIL